MRRMTRTPRSAPNGNGVTVRKQSHVDLGRMTNDGRSPRTTPIAFALVVLAFVAATLFASWRSLDIDAESRMLLSNALPSVAVLSAATDDLRDLEAASDDFPDLPPEQQATARSWIEHKWRDLDAHLTTYRALPMFEGEHERYDGTVPLALRAVDRALSHLFVQVDEHDIATARATADREVRSASNAAAGALRAMIAFNAEHARQGVDNILRTRQSAFRWSLALDAVAMLLAIAASVWVVRVFAAYARLLGEHGALVERRAAELEQFGKRVAHDLLSPLSALTYCLGAFKHASEDDPKLADALARARACVARARAMVEGIFEFSRAGGNPSRGERADVRDVIAEVGEEISSVDGRDRPEIVVEPFAPIEVACSRGVLTSILANLMRNATKYMSDSATKRISLRALDRGDHVRIDVEDTGPGVPAGLEAAIFEPYVRAEGVTQPGLGLGLATVKRLCEAHGGEVGLDSSIGKGAVFWFTLPKAAAPDALRRVT